MIPIPHQRIIGFFLEEYDTTKGIYTIGQTQRLPSHYTGDNGKSAQTTAKGGIAKPIREAHVVRSQHKRECRPRRAFGHGEDNESHSA